MKTTHRATFGGRLSAVLVTAGSAVGLGNIWRFPYVAGENGGGAFLLIYILSVLLLGVPIMLSEFAIGRNTHRNAVGAYRTLSSRWSILGYNSILAPLLIMGFYLVVSGWTLEYMIHSLTGEFTRISTPEAYESLFNAFTQNPWKPLLYTVVFTLLTHGVIALGVQKGIERSARIMMPLLLLILVVLAVHSILLPGGTEGVKFLFAPDFSKVTPSTVLTALGQAFFSLSIGLGCLVTYASYFKNDTNITHTALQVAFIDTLVAVLAGLVIFPAVFSVGIEPTAGPSLVFVTLPAIFNTLPLSMVWSTIFFLLLVIAALTSTISLHEVLTVYVQEEWHLSRRAAAWIVTGRYLSARRRDARRQTAPAGHQPQGCGRLFELRQPDRSGHDPRARNLSSRLRGQAVGGGSRGGSREGRKRAARNACRGRRGAAAGRPHGARRLRRRDRFLQIAQPHVA